MTPPEAEFCRDIARQADEIELGQDLHLPKLMVGYIGRTTICIAGNTLLSSSR